MACQRQIIRFIRASMLPGYDVFNMVGKFAVFLPQPAIFAPVPGALPDQLPRLTVHSLRRIAGQILASLEFENGYEVGRVDQRFIFGAIVVCKRTIVGKLCQRIDSLLNRSGHSQLYNPARGFGIQATAERTQQAIQCGSGAHASQ